MFFPVFPTLVSKTCFSQDGIYWYIPRWKPGTVQNPPTLSVTNGNKFISMTSNIHWSYVLQCNMTQSALSLFHSKLIELHEKWFHLQTLKNRYDNINISFKIFYITLKRNTLYHKILKINSLPILFTNDSNLFTVGRKLADIVELPW